MAQIIHVLFLAALLCHSSSALHRLRLSDDVSPSGTAHTKSVSIGLLMDPQSVFGVSTKAALQMAISDINATAKGLEYSARLVTPSYPLRGRGHSCFADQELLAMQELINKSVDFIIGPGCSTRDSVVNWLADYVNLAMMSFRDIHRTGKENHPTFSSLALSLTSSAKPITDLVQHLGWKRVALVQDNRFSWYGCLWLMPAVKKALQAAGVDVSIHLDMDETRFTADNYTKYPYHSGQRKLKWDLVAKLIRPKARVVLYCGFPGFRTNSFMASREFMLGITKDGYLGNLNEYAFVLLHVERSHFFTSGLPFAIDDGLDEKAKHVFNGVLTFSDYMPPVSPKWMEKFHRRINILTRQTGGKYQWNGWETTAYDATQFLYTSTVKMLEHGQSPRDGRSLLKLFMAKHHHIGASGQIWIDKEGHRVGSYIVRQVQSGYFTPVLNFTPSQGKYGQNFRLQKMNELKWRQGLSRQPLSTPFCGFLGEHCHKESTVPASLTIGVLVPLASLVLLAIFIFCFWRQLLCIKCLLPVSTQLKTASWWLEDFSDQDSYTDYLRAPSVLKMRKNGSEEESGPGKKVFYLYKGRRVAVKKTNFWIEELTREGVRAIQEMANISHPNIVQFVGAAAPNNHIMFVTLGCERGTLEAALNNSCLTGIMKALSLMDILQGMTYLYKIQMPHGHLKLKHCLVTYRWQVRVTGFGLHSREAFRTMEVAQGKQGEDDKPDINPAEHRRLRRSLNNYQVKTLELHDVLAFRNIVMVVLDTTGACLELPPHNLYESNDNKQGTENGPEESDGTAPQMGEPVIDPTLAPFHDLCSSIGGEHTSFASLLRATENHVSLRLTNRGSDPLMERVTGYSAKLEQVVAQHTELLQKERQKMEVLLLQMLPKSVVELLQEGETYDALCFMAVGVMFSMIEGMDALIWKLTPMELVELLNQMCSKIDNIIQRYADSVYKVENISDCYLVATGAPVGLSKPGQLAQLALTLLAAQDVDIVPPQQRGELKMRIGLHIGNCCSCIMGNINPRYCLVGDTINTASRMMSTGEGGRIHISKEFVRKLQRLKNHKEFKVVERGLVYMKGKGKVETFWLESGQEDYEPSTDQ